jgi:hypothetical protein
LVQRTTQPENKSITINNPQTKDLHDEHQTALYRTVATGGGCRRGNHRGTERIRSKRTYLL